MLPTTTSAPVRNGNEWVRPSAIYPDKIDISTTTNKLTRRCRSIAVHAAPINRIHELVWDGREGGESEGAMGIGSVRTMVASELLSE
jgi:hypothetical protein